MILREKQKAVPLIPLFIQRSGDLSRLLCGDALDLRKALRLFLQHPERILSKPFHDPVRQNLPDSADHAGTKITLDRGGIFRPLEFKRNDPELVSVNRVGSPVPLQLKKLTRSSFGKNAYRSKFAVNPLLLPLRV